MDNTKTGERITEITAYASIPFWFSVWSGTKVAGGAFGFSVGCWEDGLASGVVCQVFGVVLASILGAFTIANVAFVTWCFWLSRFRVVMGFLAGGLTGVIATLSPSSGPPLSASWKVLALAGLFGTLGGGLAGRRCHTREAMPRGFLQRPWRFTLRDLFIRITVISALLATYAIFIHRILADRP